MGLFDKLGFTKLKESLAKTRDGLFTKVAQLVTGKSAIDEELLEGLEETLIGADVGVSSTEEIIKGIRKRVKDEGRNSSGDLNDLLTDEIKKQFADGANGTADTALIEKPHVIMVVGINGVGKTTTIGKLANLHVKAGRNVVIAAADTFRAAASEQLEEWSRRAGAQIIQQEHGSDPAAVAFDALASATAKGADVVIVDTAGRLHTKVNLMEELKKIRRVLGKQSPNAPHEVLLVIDASTGQNGIQQARQFDTAVGITGLVLTKLDGTAKGGIVLAISKEMKLPVKYIGVGEKIDDLQPFDRKEFVEALFSR